MAVNYTNKPVIKVALPKKQEVRFAPDKEHHGHIHKELIDTPNIPTDDLFITTDEDTSLDTHNHGVTTGDNITSISNVYQHAPAAQKKIESGVGTEDARARRVPRARTVEYGGEVYQSLTKCLKALGLCRDRFKYLKRTRKELRTDKAIIGIMVHERRAEAMQGTSYVIAINGEVCFERNLTAACTRVNQILQLPPKQAMTQGQVSKYRYEHNRRPCNKDKQITLYEAFTSCLARLLIRHNLLEVADKAIFKARMSVVSNTLNNEDDILEIVDDDNSHLEALSDLAKEYHSL